MHLICSDTKWPSGKSDAGQCLLTRLKSLALQAVFVQDNRSWIICACGCAVPDQIMLSQPAVQRAGNNAPQGLAGSGRRRRTLLVLRNADVTVAVVTSAGQVNHRPSILCFSSRV